MKSRSKCMRTIGLMLCFMTLTTGGFISILSTANTDTIEEYQDTDESPSDDNEVFAEISFDNLYNLRPIGRRDNMEIRYGNPTDNYFKLSIIRGYMGSNRKIKAPVGDRIIISYSPYTTLRCLYFDITAPGTSSIRFNDMDIHTSFTITNKTVLKPIFRSEFSYIESENPYHCLWPEP